MCYIDSQHPAVSEPFPHDLSGMTDKRREKNNRKKLSSCWELLVYNIKKSFAPKSLRNYPTRALREDNDCLRFKGDYLAPLSMRSSRVFRRWTGWSPQPSVLPLLMEKPWKSRNNWTLISLAWQRSAHYKESLELLSDERAARTPHKEVSTKKKCLAETRLG